MLNGRAGGRVPAEVDGAFALGIEQLVVRVHDDRALVELVWNHDGSLAVGDGVDGTKGYDGVGGGETVEFVECLADLEIVFGERGVVEIGGKGAVVSRKRKPGAKENGPIEGARGAEGGQGVEEAASRGSGRDQRGGVGEAPGGEEIGGEGG